MELIREYLKKPWAKTVLVALAGMLFGLIILGWWLMPVQWTDATPEFMREDLKADYLSMVVDSYSVNKDVALAKTRWGNLGKGADELFKIIQGRSTNVAAADLAAFARIVNAEITIPSETTSAPSSEAASQNAVDNQPSTLAEKTTSAKTGGLSGAMPVVLSLFCVLTLVLGFVVFYIFLKRGKLRRPAKQDAMTGYDEEEGADYFSPKVGSSTRSPGGTPVSQFMTTYMQGEDQYDDSFTIDNPMGEFLGECGVSISDTIGVGDSKKVAAFEVWLFDKNDIQTVTKVLMSQHTFNDPASKQALMSKGEPILSEPGKTILLETATLQLEARIVDMNYGPGPLPANSHFDRMTLELVVWPKA
ncbi:MAG: hypothetical protein C0391_06555 [Anaerolinea sp.]|nr:hypothetical protein [Anaerolinea sp.]